MALRMPRDSSKVRAHDRCQAEPQTKGLELTLRLREKSELRRLSYTRTRRGAGEIDMSAHCNLGFVPEWVVSLADDHLESLRVLFRAAGEKRAEMDALSNQKVHGNFPKHLDSCLELSIAKSAFPSPAAVAAAERRSRRELDSLSEQIAEARRNSERSMKDTLRMMCAAMARAGGTVVTEETKTAWSWWFSRKLDNELKCEKARLKRSLLRQTRKRRSVLTVKPSRNLGLTQPGTEAPACLKEEGGGREYLGNEPGIEADTLLPLNLRTDRHCQLKKESVDVEGTEAKADAGKGVALDSSLGVKEEEQDQRIIASAPNAGATRLRL